MPKIVLNNKCECEGACFARGKETGRCGILTEAASGKCSFQKADRHYTNGVFYPDYPYELRGKL